MIDISEERFLCKSVSLFHIHELIVSRRYDCELLITITYLITIHASAQIIAVIIILRYRT